MATVGRAAAFLVGAGLALRRIAKYFEIRYDAEPQPDDPISITREAFLAAREACWRAFAGWRVNDDAVLLGLAGLTMAPYAEWSSDRSLRPWSPAITKATRNRRGKENGNGS